MAELFAPAKLNLGLEIIGKRPDGYHELRTIFSAVSIVDRLVIEPADRTVITVDDPGIVEANLVQATLDRWERAGLPRPNITVTLEKAIPSAAGLGGASSDAATVLSWLANAAGIAPLDPRILALARELGSDVPFFLRGGLQFGSGRGEILTPLPYVHFGAVVVTPVLKIPDKTRSLFAALTSSDMSDGSGVDAILAGLPTSITEPQSALINTFERPLYDLYPELGTLARAIHHLTGRFPSITGAGPSMYLTAPTPEMAYELHERLLDLAVPLDSSLYLVQSVPALETAPDAHA